ncbi:hypothetical protein ACU8L5_09305 [Rhizobium leguminosarum]|uniref:hypothetical protein n=1 Tax=Rhizobium leguminosarum TaxID=384 RepID=UPI00293DA648|nr:hypothetical protein [Rhizobium leguminosarum]MDV4164151.1 hypothetical protein [Rhizobium leguminosarum]MDV4174033.1 hypothetical protein [Rhizobium leguminosarum]
MIFTNLAKIAAWLALTFGAFQLVIGFGIATEFFGPYDAALTRYAPGAGSSGRLIDRGFYAVFLAIALGTLAEISLEQRRGRR